MMKQSEKKPPIFDRIEQVFGVKWESGVIVTYGDTVHSLSALTPDLVVHEGIHVRQQTEMDKDVWWEKYFTDREFRLSQELEAYYHQLQYCREFYGRDLRKVIQKHIYRSMVTLYGDMVGSEEEAKELLAKYTPVYNESNTSVSNN